MDERPIDDIVSLPDLQASACEVRAKVASDGRTQHWPNKDRVGGQNGQTLVPISEFVGSLRGMNTLQVARDTIPTERSLFNGLTWERSTAGVGRYVYISRITVTNDFFGSNAAFTAALAQIRRKDNGEYREVFKQARSSHYLVLLCGFENNSLWGAIVIHMRTEDDGSVVADRIAIIDPVAADRGLRRQVIRNRLAQILGEGDITIAPDVQEGGFAHRDVAADLGHWPAGFVVYAILCEFFRRLKVAHFRGQGLQNPDYLYERFEEVYNFDGYRQRMAAANAHNAIERSEFQARLALELPGYNENQPVNYDPIALRAPGPRRAAGGGRGGPAGAGPSTPARRGGRGGTSIDPNTPGGSAADPMILDDAAEEEVNMEGEDSGRWEPVEAQDAVEELDNKNMPEHVLLTRLKAEGPLPRRRVKKALSPERPRTRGILDRKTKGKGKERAPFRV